MPFLLCPSMLHKALQDQEWMLKVIFDSRISGSAQLGHVWRSSKCHFSQMYTVMNWLLTWSTAAPFAIKLKEYNGLPVVLVPRRGLEPPRPYGH